MISTMCTKTLLQDHGLRTTRQRVALYDALRDCRSHPTAEELYHMVRPGMDRLSLATVYNTLEVFCQAGLARRLPTTNGVSRYDADMSEHFHLRFRDTGEIVDIPAALSERLLASLPRPVLEAIEAHFGTSIDGVNVQLLARRTTDG